MTKVITKKDLAAWLNHLLSEYVLIAPVETEGVLLFQPVSRIEEIVFNFDNTALSPKGWFFPITATLFTVERRDGRTSVIPAQVEEKAVFFGLHPCDAQGINILDKPFLSAPEDAFYRQRRSHAILVGLSCQKPCPECFCTSLGSAPNDPSKLDILLTEVGESYIVQIVTEKGRSLLDKASLQDRELGVPSPPPLVSVPVEGIVEAMRRVFDHPYWGRVADRCIHCNICAYVCPVCYCFDIRDFTDSGKTERVRTWESCQSPGFTRIAGGYDPRPTKGARMRQRFYHKLLYMPEQFGIMGCTGCGRCVRSCPVNIDIREIISDVQKLGAQGVRR